MRVVGFKVVVSVPLEATPRGVVMTGVLGKSVGMGFTVAPSVVACACFQCSAVRSTATNKPRLIKILIAFDMP